MSIGSLPVVPAASTAALMALAAGPASASELMVGSHPPALGLPHFPTPAQALVWRNWEIVPVERRARSVAVGWTGNEQHVKVIQPFVTVEADVAEIVRHVEQASIALR